MSDISARPYATQMEAARKGIVTPQMGAVAAKEDIDPERLRELVATGQAVIPANVHHACLEPSGIGFALRTKINVNLGTSARLVGPGHGDGQGQRCRAHGRRVHHGPLLVR